jgi:alpha-L-arabinofuranosidase
MKAAALLLLALSSTAAIAREYHVWATGDDRGNGSPAQMLKTISAAARLAQPGDTITVHEGVYREEVAPPRGGESDAQRIVYQAAPGEKVVVTGSEVAKNWNKVSGDTWKTTLPSRYFGKFNPYRDLIHGDWFGANGRQHHTGAVYVHGDWLQEAPNLPAVMQPAGATPLWYAKVDGVSSAEYLVNIAWLKPADGHKVPAARTAARKGTRVAACSEGGNCVGFIRGGDWLRYDGVDFGAGADRLQLRVASATESSVIEVRSDSADGQLLGTAKVDSTGDWQHWTTATVAIPQIAGKKNICLVITAPRVATDNTTIWAQFPAVDPNREPVEINVRQTVFYPPKPGVNYLTVRGFTLEHAATPWAPPTAEQKAIIGTHWSKGWIIENNVIRYSKCCGVALGKYGDEWDNRAESAEGYVGTIHRGLANGWHKGTIGNHVVRGNHISHCEQTGVVGSLGCAFSTVTGNEIHEIHVHQLFGGAEMAGIKFHGAIDVTISRNHIYRCGNAAGIWLDWMAQGAHVTGNLMHDNFGGCGDIFFEMQHGPIFVANNLLLSKRRVFEMNSQGIAFAHNLITGGIYSYRGDTRITPFHTGHSTALAGMYPAAQGDSGDHRFYNNLFVAPCNLHAIDGAVLPCFAAGNVFTAGTQPSKFDTDAVLDAKFNPEVKLEKKNDGWYLSLREDKSWAAQPRQLVTTALLGKTKVSHAAYDNVDATPIRLDTDYFGHKRSDTNPCPGPFELPAGGAHVLKVWPRAGD